MPVELKKEDAQKELDGLLDKEKQAQDKNLPKDQQDKIAAEKKKAEETRIAAETQAKKDAELLAKKDDEIKDEAEKKRKAELLEKQRIEAEAKLSAEDKIKRIKEESQKRIDELVNKLKQVEDKSSKEAQGLRKEIEILRKEKETPKEEDISVVVEKELNEQQEKILKEDASKPKEQRREMTDSDLDDWMLEDAKNAVAWIQRREMRRLQEKNKILRTKGMEKMAKDIVDKQQNSWERVYIKHPDLDLRKRGKELESQGKSVEEIHGILKTENEKYRLSSEIAKSHPEWQYEPDLPELVVVEMEKELGKSPSISEDRKLIDELSKQVEELSAKLAEQESSDEGIHSTTNRTNQAKIKLSEKEKETERIMRSAGATQAMIDNAISQIRENQNA